MKHIVVLVPDGIHETLSMICTQTSLSRPAGARPITVAELAGMLIQRSLLPPPEVVEPTTSAPGSGA